MSDIFRITFSGGILPGFSLDLVRRHVRERLKATPDQLVRMFSGRPLCLKKDLSEAAALEYLRKLQTLGLDVTLETAVAHKAPSPALAPAQPVAIESSPIAEEQTAKTPASAPPAGPASPPPATSSQGWINETSFTDFARTHLNLSRAEALLNGSGADEILAPTPVPEPAPAAVQASSVSNKAATVSSPLETKQAQEAVSLQLSGTVQCPHCGNTHSIHGDVLLQASLSNQLSKARQAS